MLLENTSSLVAEEKIKLNCPWDLPPIGMSAVLAGHCLVLPNGVKTPLLNSKFQVHQEKKKRGGGKGGEKR